MQNIIEGYLTENENTIIDKICDLCDLSASYHNYGYVHINIDEDEYKLSIYTDKDAYICDVTSVTYYECMDYKATSDIGILLQTKV
jgi:hypothetical protein